EGPCAPPCGTRHNVRIIRTRRQTHGSRCLAGALPCNTCFRVAALCYINQFGKIVGLSRIDGRQITPFSFSRLILAKFSLVFWKRWWRPRPHRRRRSIIAAKCHRNGDEKLRRSNKSDLHKNLPISPEPSITPIMAGRKREGRQNTVTRSVFVCILFSGCWRARFQDQTATP